MGQSGTLAATSVFNVANVIVSACNAVAANAPCGVFAASVIPYPAKVVGVPVSDANVCAGIVKLVEITSV